MKLDIPAVLSAMEINNEVEHLALLGCPDEEFALETAKFIGGLLFVFDPDKNKTNSISKAGLEAGQESLAVINRDYEKTGTGLPKKSLEYALIIDAFNASNHEKMLKEAYRILKPDGKLGLLLRSEKNCTFLKSLDIDPEKFELIKEAIKLVEFHYGLIFRKV